MNIEHKKGNCYRHPRMYFESNLGIPPCHKQTQREFKSLQKGPS